MSAIFFRWAGEAFSAGACGLDFGASFPLESAAAREAPAWTAPNAVAAPTTVRRNLRRVRPRGRKGSGSGGLEGFEGGCIAG